MRYRHETIVMTVSVFLTRNPINQAAMVSSPPFATLLKVLRKNLVFSESDNHRVRASMKIARSSTKVAGSRGVCSHMRARLSPHPNRRAWDLGPTRPNGGQSGGFDKPTDELPRVRGPSLTRGGGVIVRGLCSTRCSWATSTS